MSQTSMTILLNLSCTLILATLFRDLFPGVEDEPLGDDGPDHLGPHQLVLQVGVGVVFAGPVVPVALGRCIERGKSIEPRLATKIH